MNKPPEAEFRVDLRYSAGEVAPDDTAPLLATSPRSDKEVAEAAGARFKQRFQIGAENRELPPDHLRDAGFSPNPYCIR